MVDKNQRQSLYTISSARRRLARWRVCEAPHCSHGDRACGHALVAMFVPPRRREASARESLAFARWATWAAKRWPAKPGVVQSGCLTSESEERETWTAESLRAACRARETLRARRPGRDFGGRRFRSTLDHASDQWDLVKRCDQPGKVLIQLESLILAQSERWRQA